MDTYRKKPVVIRAFQFLEGMTEEDFPLWLRAFYWPDEPPAEFAKPNHWWFADDDLIRIHTLEGRMDARVGDFIICGVQGELYPCKPDIFEQTYEKINDQD